MYHLYNFLETENFSADLNFWIQSLCLIYEDIAFHNVGAASESEH